MARGSGFRYRGTVSGVAAVLAKLKQADEKVAKKALRAGVSKAGQLLKRAAKGKVVRKSGHLARSMYSKVKTFRNTGRVIAVVGPRTGMKQTVVRDGRSVLSNPTRYAHLVELGTKPHAIGRGSNSRKGIQTGRIHPGSKPQPFLEPSLAEQRPAMAYAVEHALVDAIRRLGV